MLWLTLVYRLAECNEKVPLDTHSTPFEFIDSELSEMYAKDIIVISDDKQNYIIGTKGKELIKRFIAMFDQFCQFEIFADVTLEDDLPEEITDDEGNVLDHCYDPRFEKTADSADLRIAMVSYAAEATTASVSGGPLDPKRIIFLQKLADGHLSEESKDFWFSFRTGSVFKEIQEIADAAYTWKDLGEDDQEGKDIAANIYTAGMLEQRKREGLKCSGCEIPLAVFELAAEEKGMELFECPNPDCGASFREDDPPDAEYECPKCKKDIRAGQNTCYGCGSKINFSLPSGSVSEEEEIVEEEEDYYGGYYSYGWYNPWSPAVDALAVGFLCGAILF